MKKLIAATFVLLGLSFSAEAQITTSKTLTPTQMVQNVLLGGGVTASNVTYTGYANGISTFSATTGSNLGITSGIYMTTGSYLASDPKGGGLGQDGPFGPSTNFQSVSQNPGIASGDADLDTILKPQSTISYDAAVLEFDFVPLSDTIKFRYRFGSEEYNQFVPQPSIPGYNDVFAFFLSSLGAGLQKTNIALLPGTTIPVSIYSVNNGYSTGTSAGPCSNCAYFVDNIAGAVNTAYGGLTTVLTAKYHVICGTKYHIKIAIADAGDELYDSGVFLEAGSFSANVPINVAAIVNNTPGDTILTEGCGSATLYFTRPKDSINTAQTFTYGISGTATNGVDYTTLSGTVNFPVGSDSIGFHINAVNDGVNDGIESLIITLHRIICGIPQTSTYTIYLKDPTPLVLVAKDTTICYGQAANPSVLATGGAGSNNYSWTSGTVSYGNTAGIVVSPIIGTKYLVSVTDKCGAVKHDSVFVSVNTLATAQPMLDQTLCAGESATFNTVVSGGTGNVYSWQTIFGPDQVTQVSSTQASVSPVTGNGTFLFTVKNKCNQVNDSVHIFIEPCNVTFPNVVTPSVGGVNSYLYFINLDKYPNTTLLVYDRWGVKVHESANYQNDWKPTLVDGTYYYILKFADKKVHTSFFQLIK
jgi:gliding motility-associated-like protein